MQVLMQGVFLNMKVQLILLKIYEVCQELECYEEIKKIQKVVWLTQHVYVDNFSLKVIIFSSNPFTRKAGTELSYETYTERSW